jgi:ABC-type spermidine/putrescine transport system permease subunit II
MFLFFICDIIYLDLASRVIVSHLEIWSLDPIVNSASLLICLPHISISILLLFFIYDLAFPYKWWTCQIPYFHFNVAFLYLRYNYIQTLLRESSSTI